MKKIMIGLLALCMASCSTGCNNKKAQKNNVQTDFSQLGYISATEDAYVLDNGSIRLELGKANGNFISLKNAVAGEELIADGFGLPFSIEYGYDRNDISIYGGAPTVITGLSAYKKGENEVLKVEYANLALNRSKKQTGIKAVVEYTIGKGEYFTYTCSFDLSGMEEGYKGYENGIYSLKLMDGYMKGAGENERLTAPTWNGGQYWKNPSSNTKFKSISGATLGYPGEDAETLQAGWLDLSGDKGGYGIGLINRKEMITEFRIFGNEDEGTLKVSNVMFDPSSVVSDGIPLLKGESFKSDSILVVAHSGDWHNTADAYREEYHKAFTLADGTPDYINYTNTSNRIKNLDYITRACAMTYGGAPMTFDEMYNQTVMFQQEIGFDYEHHAFWLHGQNTQGYAYDVPFMTPTHAPSGGDQGLKTLASRLQALGSSIYAYEHPFALDPDRAEIKQIIDRVDPLQHTEYWDGVTHHSACIDNEVMQKLWAEQIMPPQAELGLNGWQLDQCPLQQTVCNMEGHDHGLTAEERLTSHAKGVNKIQKLVRSSAEDGYIISESRSDVLSRYCDMFQLCWHAGLLWDGYWEYGAAVYTHPDVIYQPSTIGLFWDFDYNKYITQNMMLQAALYGGTICLSDGGSIEVKREFVRFRHAMREVENTGYPFGFRDNVGLSVSDVWLDARVYVKGDYVTVVYLTNWHVKDAKISVNLEKLGFSGKGSVEFSVTQSANKLDQLTFNVNDLSSFNK